MDNLNPEIAKLIAAKERRRNQLAALPIKEKVRAIIRLQEMVAPILRLRGKTVHIWRME